MAYGATRQSQAACDNRSRCAARQPTAMTVSTAPTNINWPISTPTLKNSRAIGIEDCGKNEGNQKNDNWAWINDWLLEGMVSGSETLNCTPGLVAAPPDCGFGPELVLILPGLMWIHRRRLRKA